MTSSRMVVVFISLLSFSSGFAAEGRPSDAVLPTEGLVGHWDFDGNGHPFVISGEDSFSDLDTFTATIWFKGSGALLSRGVRCVHPRTWALSVSWERNGRQIRFEYAVAGALVREIFEIGPQTEPSSWHMAGVVYEAGVARIVFDGKPLGAVALKEPLPASENDLVIGGSHCFQKPQNAGIQFRGSIDEARLYDRALSEGEVRMVFHGGRLGMEPARVEQSPPSPPRTLTTTARVPNRVDLSWESPEGEPQIDHYHVLRDGQSISRQDAAAGTLFSDVIGVEPETSYSYEVRAVDLAGQESLGARLSVRTPPSSGLPVFPGAEGFGVLTRAGRGGEVIRVSSLKERGPGSLFACINRRGPRVCVFEVSGVIDLTERLIIEHPFITIAGESAPSPGITLKGAGLYVRSHDVLIRHLAIRPGARPYLKNPGASDGLAILGTSDGSAETYNVVVDHCSISWAIDENVSSWFPGVHDITISNSIVSEALYRSMHPMGDESLGLLVGRHTKRFAIIRNLFANNRSRNPRLPDGSESLVVNNLVFNSGNRPIPMGGPDPSTVKASLIANAFIAGADTKPALPLPIGIHGELRDESSVFVSNIACQGISQRDPWTCVRNDVGPAVIETRPPVWSERVSIRAADTLESWLLHADRSSGVGSRPADRDEIDRRVIGQVAARTGKIIDCAAPGDLPYAPGRVRGATVLTLTLADGASEREGAYEGRMLRITAGPGVRQVRRVMDYSGGTRVATIDEPWEVPPNETSEYELLVDCMRNAGGWPEEGSNRRAVLLPDEPSADDDGDGYTNLEELLHEMARRVEGAPSPARLP